MPSVTVSRSKNTAGFVQKGSVLGVPEAKVVECLNRISVPDSLRFVILIEDKPRAIVIILSMLANNFKPHFKQKIFRFWRSCPKSKTLYFSSVSILKLAKLSREQVLNREYHVQARLGFIRIIIPKV